MIKRSKWVRSYSLSFGEGRGEVNSGTHNCICTNSNYAAIAAGVGNMICAPSPSTYSCYGFIGGGLNNTLSGNYNAILGGQGNTIGGGFDHVGIFLLKIHGGSYSHVERVA